MYQVYVTVDFAKGEINILDTLEYLIIPHCGINAQLKQIFKN